jgi:hypothetical protein
MPRAVTNYKKELRKQKTFKKKYFRAGHGGICL